MWALLVDYVNLRVAVRRSVLELRLAVLTQISNALEDGQIESAAVLTQTLEGLN